jgi:hypothetical protein
MRTPGPTSAPLVRPHHTLNTKLLFYFPKWPRPSRLNLHPPMGGGMDSCVTVLHRLRLRRQPEGRGGDRTQAGTPVPSARAAGLGL